MMPARSYQIPGGARVLLFSCEVCGGTAHFSRGSSILAALHSGDVKRAGEWYCGWKDGEPICIHQPGAEHEQAS